jgi:hypothetical protein
MIPCDSGGMKLRTLIMAAAVAGLSAGAADAATQACSVEVKFASVCCGVDRGAYAELKAFLQGSPLAAETTDQAWGMEGEQTLCARAKSPADAEKLFGEVKARMPAGAKAGYIVVSVGGKERLKVPAVRRNKVGPK